jgi:kinesin family protein 2/24
MFGVVRDGSTHLLGRRLQVDNIAVYERAAAPLIHWAAQGGVAALFMYGQTGSGKTFTMSSIEELGVLQLFEHTVAASKREGTPVRVRVAFFEITGKKCFDLLHHKRREIFLKDSEDGYVILQVCTVHDRAHGCACP